MKFDEKTQKRIDKIKRQRRERELAAIVAHKRRLGLWGRAAIPPETTEAVAPAESGAQT